MSTPARHLLTVTLAALTLGACADVGEPEPLARRGLPRAGGVTLVDRLTWGATDRDAARLAVLGPERWTERQLHPTLADEALPPEAQRQIEALSIATTPPIALVQQLDAENKAANALTDPDQKKVAQKAYQDHLNRLGREAATRSLLRDLYATDQLREQMSWFWFNHFNVHLYKANLRALVGDYEEQAIRPHVFGRFRSLVGATLHHPAMLRYLDNTDNAANHLNENYARELMELHTLGVNGGYIQKDVQELARILTGVGINASVNAPKVRPALQAQYVRNGMFEFNPNRHDYGDKLLLGHTIKGRGLAEVDEALDILCRHPSTARFVSRKIAVAFVADDPPPALVDRMVGTWRSTDGDIDAVIATMIRSPEFQASLGGKFKDPMHFAVSAVRAAYGDRVVLNVAPLSGWLGRMGEPLYGRETPDGYPLTQAAWAGPGEMAVRFEIARTIGSGSAGLFKPEGASADQPAFPQAQTALYFAGGRERLGPPTRAALEHATSPQDWNTLYLSSPDFMHR